MIPTVLLIIGCIVALFVWQRFRLRYAFFSFYRQVAWSLKHAPRGRLTLDVGAGNNPHVRADVLCEKYLYDDLHRGSSVALDRPLVAGDASALPFKTGIFDVIIAKDMIEHLEDPESFFQEAGRVAHSGLFLAPNALAERLTGGNPTHLWMIQHEANKLHFIPKSQPILDPEAYYFFITKVNRNDFLLDYWDSLRITYNWTGQPECVIEGKPGTAADGFMEASTGEAIVRLNLTGIEWLRAFLKRWVRTATHMILSSHHTVDWGSILACPKCHGDVSVSTNAVNCPSCGLQFPVEQGIPIMLLDHAVSLV